MSLTLPSTGAGPAADRAATRSSAPLARLVRAEVRWVLRRPRTLVLLGLFALIPVLIAVGIVLAGSPTGGPGLIAQVAGNGLVLPVVALTLALTLLLPLAVTAAAADAVAGEVASGTLRGLLLSPVGRWRLIAMKAAGVATVAVAAVAVIAVVGFVAGSVMLGGGEMITLSGTTLGLGEGIGRVALAALWVVGQLLAIGAVALAVSTLTEHPLVVLATVLGGLIVFGVLGAIPALEWIEPYLLTSGWTAIADVLRDPLPLGELASTTGLAAVYAVVGATVTLWRMQRREG